MVCLLVLMGRGEVKDRRRGRVEKWLLYFTRLSVRRMACTQLRWSALAVSLTIQKRDYIAAYNIVLVRLTYFQRAITLIGMLSRMCARARVLMCVRIRPLIIFLPVQRFFFSLILSMKSDIPSRRLTKDKRYL